MMTPAERDQLQAIVVTIGLATAKVASLSKETLQEMRKVLEAVNELSRLATPPTTSP